MIKLLNSGSKASDYTMFQKAMALGVSGRNVEKVTALNALLTKYPNSAL